ncbi:sulfatase-like hydrolase/transferase [Cryobacterium tagatosivorans]|uniref:Arylsulfatase n=1 Tax=Cryobacterium tagatosivorans TaxID=1259199 RepID=A0A4R8UDQ3_9MICO|nr:sulfatase-like hydrolase/transferase [Cryobacterium tagatosivorans]TFB51066.1 arylsulfatase [Cryobacterium tagatosivorans]
MRRHAALAEVTARRVILIVADDLGHGDLGINNGGATATPAIERIMAEGATLTRCYSASPVCAPARAGLLTGRYPHRTGAVTPQEMLGLDRLALDERTIADVFVDAGWRTGLVGKWHNGALDERYHPTARGFQEFVGFSGGWMDYWEWRLEEGLEVRASDGSYLTDALTDAALDFIRRHADEPFFLTLAYNAPHAPLQAPAERVRRHLDRGASPTLARLYAMVEELDGGIGRVLDALDDLDLADDTLIIFLSDNGPAFEVNPNIPREDGVGTDLTRPNLGLRGSKRSVYEGGIRVPGAIRWPAAVQAGSRHEGVVHFVDLLPTILSITGVPQSSGLPLDGIDRSDELTGARPEAEIDRFWQWNLYEPVAATNAAHRAGPWKLVLPALNWEPATDRDAALVAAHRRLELEHVYDPDSAPHEVSSERPRLRWPTPSDPQLYNLDLDPEERHDVAASYPERAAAMRRVLETWFTEVERDRTRGPAHPRSDRMEERQ